MNIPDVVKAIQSRDEALTIVIGNQKGGVGKTTNTYLIAYTLAKMGIHTLVADLDPQANATKTLMLTKSQQEDTVYSIKKTLMVGVQEKDLTDLPVKIMDNLDLIPSYIDFQDFTKYLYQNTNNEYEETHLLEPLFNPLKKKYDVILLDVPPFSIEITRNAVIFSDFALISLQTHDDSLSGAEEYVNTLSKLQQEYQLDIEVIGILPMLHDARNGVDQTIIQSAKDEFGEENVFTNIVTQMARIKRFPINGITDKDRFDKRVLDKYQQVTDELLSRIGLFIDDKEAK
ncbi:ParA family protein (plasmid) [Lactiplantibacillus plantarum subsp. plantarum]|uniref:ParA family protein n=1 Tax=Lactobacillaceae TaxID=33958 RepID=UPI000CFBA690|nr:MULTISPECIES: ParA family protein [Lactobacillaceae]AVK64900.1 ATPase [Lactobacillus sp. CBA3606]MBY8576051.1 ParA family protein [Lactiplantibacillus plantarum]MCW1911818.1 ParA family protein [Lactiplantibacillus paraplantarum]QHM38970.1 Sporulation initiation inhibitor protein Soj [Lactiplantibacillus plantarum]QJU52182.1 chromosome partitioning protein ParA [Lactiplantibacillus paraplantarum]